MPFGMCWGLDLTASLVLIMGTESYDGREHKYVDYPVTDLLHMTGLASRYALLCTMYYAHLFEDILSFSVGTHRSGSRRLQYSRMFNVYPSGGLEAYP